METVKVKINQDTINYLQRLHFEVESRQDVIQRIIEAHMKDDNADILESKVLKKYSEELSELKAEYEIAKQQVTEQYVPSELKSDMYFWNIDFQAGVMSIGVRQ